MTYPHRRARHGVAWAEEQLRTQGLYVSRESLRRYARMLRIPRIKAGSQEEFRFNAASLERLSRVVVLKALGLTNEEVAQWFRRPSREMLRTRIGIVTMLLARAAMLADSLDTRK